MTVTAQIMPRPQLEAGCDLLPSNANGGHLANPDEVLVRQWPTGKLRELAADLERSEINTGKPKLFDQRCYLAFCLHVIAGIEQHAPSAVRARISGAGLREDD